jgi:hypothetical protein
MCQTFAAWCSGDGWHGRFSPFPSLSITGEASNEQGYSTRHDRESEQVPSDMVELTSIIANCRWNIVWPEPVLNRAVSTKRRRRILNLVQDALSQLRLDMKYLVFDLEATRRERNSFRQELEERTNPGDE